MLNWCWFEKFGEGDAEERWKSRGAIDQLGSTWSFEFAGARDCQVGFHDFERRRR